MHQIGENWKFKYAEGDKGFCLNGKINAEKLQTLKSM
jgi:hypothetical protein